eukprot:160740_1
MVAKAQKRILRLQELGMIIESNLENDIIPKTRKIEAQMESKVEELNEIIGGDGIVAAEKVRDVLKDELDVMEDYADKTRDLGNKIKKCELEAEEFVVEMKKAQVYLETKRATFKSLDVIRTENRILQNNKRMIINNDDVMNEIKWIESEQSNIQNEVENIDNINVNAVGIKLNANKINSELNSFENEYKNIKDIDNKANTIANTIETHMNRIQQISNKIENNLKKDIRPKAQKIRLANHNKIKELDSINRNKTNVSNEEIEQWKTEFQNQTEMVKNFVLKNNNLHSKLQACHAELLINYEKIKEKQIDILAKKEEYEITGKLYEKAAFEENVTKHSGQMLAMVAAPNKYEMATSAKDKTVKLWKINLEQNQKLVPFFSAKVSGYALSLAYNKIGNYLAAGCAYKRGAEGIIIIWGTNKGIISDEIKEDMDEDICNYSIKCIFASCNKLRFSKVHCIAWSNDSKYLFGGDTTGIIWVWDVVNKTQLARIDTHKDVVNNISISHKNNALFSCSLDHTICVFNLNKLKKKKKSTKKKNISSKKKSISSKNL